MSVLMYEAHTQPHPCFRMITWQLLSRMTIAMDIIIHIDSICCCNQYTNFHLCCVISLLLHNAQIHQYTDSPMHYVCIMHHAGNRQRTDSPMHRFTNAQIHQCTDLPMHGFTNALCRDSPMHRFTNARIH